MSTPTSLDALHPVPDIAPLPAPKLPIGTRLDPTKLTKKQLAHYARQIVRTVVSRKRTTIDRMRRDGYFPEMVGKKMLPGHKQFLRDILQFVQTADSVEVAGHAPWELTSRGTIANQCFIVGGSGYGAWQYGVYVLFRKVVDGKRLIYTFPEALMLEHNATFCLYEDQS